MTFLPPSCDPSLEYFNTRRQSAYSGGKKGGLGSRGFLLAPVRWFLQGGRGELNPSRHLGEAALLSTPFPAL